jgi:hypothetical protein
LTGVAAERQVARPWEESYRAVDELSSTYSCAYSGLSRNKKGRIYQAAGYRFAQPPAPIVSGMPVETAAAIRRPLPPALPNPRRRDRFFVGMSVAAALTVFAGFARTYYLKSVFPTPSFPLLFHVHGALFTAWMLLLVVQVCLAASGRMALHRRAGAIGGLLVLPMLVSGSLAAIAAARGQAPISAAAMREETTLVVAALALPPLEAMVVPLVTMLLFAVFAGAGLACRRRPDVHKRFMLLAAIAMLPAAIGRAIGRLLGAAHPAVFFGAVVFFLLAIVIYDRRRLGRVHPVTLWGGLALMLSFPARLALAKTDLWLAFAAWLIR